LHDDDDTNYEFEIDLDCSNLSDDECDEAIDAIEAHYDDLYEIAWYDEIGDDQMADDADDAEEEAEEGEVGKSEEVEKEDTVPDGMPAQADITMGTMMSAFTSSTVNLPLHGDQIFENQTEISLDLFRLCFPVQYTDACTPPSPPLPSRVIYQLPPACIMMHGQNAVASYGLHESHELQQPEYSKEPYRD